jgi:outer membrane receptor protein involved in Fe transport
VPGIRESNNTTLELGYSGLFGSRLLVAADVWHSRRNDFISPLIPQSGFVLLNPAELQEYVRPRITGFLIAGGMPPAQAQATAAVMASGMAALPGGVVSSPDLDLPGADLIVSYRNFGEIDLWGSDLSAQALFGDWNANLSASFVSDDHFETEGQIITLNAPARKVNFSVGYRNEDVGFNGDVRLRYNSEFPVNSGTFVGIRCILPADEAESELTDDCVESFTLADVTLGYDLPQIPGASLQFMVQNLFDTDYRSFVGAPEIGRMPLLRLRFDF